MCEKGNKKAIIKSNIIKAPVQHSTHDFAPVPTNVASCFMTVSSTPRSFQNYKVFLKTGGRIVNC